MIWVITGSGNGLSPVWYQAIILTNIHLLSTEPSGTNFIKIYSKISKYSKVLSTKCHYKMSAILLRPVLTHWGRGTHICISKFIIISSDNGLLPGQHQAFIWTNDGILLIGPLGTNLSEAFIKIYTFSFKKMHLKMLFVKWHPFCLGLSMC